jgi:hypothetical protein
MSDASKAETDLAINLMRRWRFLEQNGLASGPAYQSWLEWKVKRDVRTPERNRDEIEGLQSVEAVAISKGLAVDQRDTSGMTDRELYGSSDPGYAHAGPNPLASRRTLLDTLVSHKAAVAVAVIVAAVGTFLWVRWERKR